MEQEDKLERCTELLAIIVRYVENPRLQDLRAHASKLYETDQCSREIAKSMPAREIKMAERHPNFLKDRRPNFMVY